MFKPVSVVPPTLAATPTNEVFAPWVSLNKWGRRHGFGAAKQLSTDSPIFALSSANSVLVVEAGARSACWDGLEFQLGFAPRVVGDELLVHALDVQKNFEPLLSLSERIAHSGSVIVIDAGHGGSDAGAKCAFNGRCEKELTLDWARRLTPLLAQRGWRVFLTRSNDVEVALADRVAFADRCRADVFLSLHFNSSGGGREQAGVETCCLTPAGMPSNLTRGYSDDATLVFPNNAFDAENFQYAIRLHRALLEANGGLDRGVRRARFLGVLRGQQRPAVLLEGGYLSNPKEARQIADPAHRQKLAEAVARALE